jgi:hypothetical protein
MSRLPTPTTPRCGRHPVPPRASVLGIVALAAARVPGLHGSGDDLKRFAYAHCASASCPWNRQRVHRRLHRIRGPGPAPGRSSAGWSSCTVWQYAPGSRVADDHDIFNGLERRAPEARGRQLGSGAVALLVRAGAWITACHQPPRMALRSSGTADGRPGSCRRLSPPGTVVAGL